jgi:hypothetical protein
MMMEHNLIPNCSEFDYQQFRDELYWNERCDNILKANLPLLKKIYMEYGGRHLKPGEKQYSRLFYFIF